MANELIKVKATVSYNGKSYSKDNTNNLTVVDSSLTTSYVYGISASKTFNTGKTLTAITGGTIYINIRPTNGVSGDTYSLTSSNTSVANTVTSATWSSGDLVVTIPIKAKGTSTFTIKNTKTNQTVGTVTLTAITPAVFANVSADSTTVTQGVKTITSGLTHYLHIQVDNDIMFTEYSFEFVNLNAGVQNSTTVYKKNYQGGLLTFVINLKNLQILNSITVSVKRLGVEVYRFLFWLETAKFWPCVKPETDTTAITPSTLYGADKLYVGTDATTKYNLFVYWERPGETHPSAQYTVQLSEFVNGTFTSYKQVVIGARQDQGRILVTLPSTARTNGSVVTYSINSVTSSLNETMQGFIMQQTPYVTAFGNQYGDKLLTEGKDRTGRSFTTFSARRRTGYATIYVNYMSTGDTIGIDAQHNNRWNIAVESYPSELFISEGNTLKAKVPCGGFWIEWRMDTRGSISYLDSDLRFWANGVYFTKLNIWIQGI